MVITFPCVRVCVCVLGALTWLWSENKLEMCSAAISSFVPSERVQPKRAVLYPLSPQTTTKRSDDSRVDV